MSKPPEDDIVTIVQQRLQAERAAGYDEGLRAGVRLAIQHLQSITNKIDVDLVLNLAGLNTPATKTVKHRTAHLPPAKRGPNNNKSSLSSDVIPKGSTKVTDRIRMVMAGDSGRYWTAVELHKAVQNETGSKGSLTGIRAGISSLLRDGLLIAGDTKDTLTTFRLSIHPRDS